VLSDMEAVGLRDYLDTTVELRAVTWHESSFEESGSWFAAMTVRNPVTCETLILTTGSRTPLKQLVRLMQIDSAESGRWKPGDVWTREHISGWLATPQVLVGRQANRATRAGYYPLRLTRPPKPVAA